jgi:heptaprenyl diphosphate synthase
LTPSMSRTHRLVLIALLTATAAILGYLESLLPSFIPIPGVKIGLPNIVTMISIVLFNTPVALGIAVARVLLTGFMFGSLSSILYALAGGIVSCGVMGALAHINRQRQIREQDAPFSLLGISVIGAMAHNLGQLCVATIVVQNLRPMLFYLPFLLLFAIPVGLLTGTIARRLLPYLNRLLPQKSHDKSPG